MTPSGDAFALWLQARPVGLGEDVSASLKAEADSLPPFTDYSIAGVEKYLLENGRGKLRTYVLAETGIDIDTFWDKDPPPEGTFHIKEFLIELSTKTLGVNTKPLIDAATAEDGVDWGGVAQSAVGIAGWGACVAFGVPPSVSQAVCQPAGELLYTVSAAIVGGIYNAGKAAVEAIVCLFSDCEDAIPPSYSSITSPTPEQMLNICAAWYGKYCFRRAKNLLSLRTAALFTLTTLEAFQKLWKSALGYDIKIDQVFFGLVRNGLRVPFTTWQLIGAPNTQDGQEPAIKQPNEYIGGRLATGEVLEWYLAAHAFRTGSTYFDTAEWRDASGNMKGFIGQPLLNYTTDGKGGQAPGDAFYEEMILHVRPSWVFQNENGSWSGPARVSRVFSTGGILPMPPPLGAFWYDPLTHRMDYPNEATPITWDEATGGWQKPAALLASFETVAASFLQTIIWLPQDQYHPEAPGNFALFWSENVGTPSRAFRLEDIERTGLSAYSSEFYGLAKGPIEMLSDMVVRSPVNLQAILDSDGVTSIFVELILHSLQKAMELALRDLRWAVRNKELGIGKPYQGAHFTDHSPPPPPGLAPGDGPAMIPADDLPTAAKDKLGAAGKYLDPKKQGVPPPSKGTVLDPGTGSTAGAETGMSTGAKVAIGVGVAGALWTGFRLYTKQPIVPVSLTKRLK